MSLSKVGKYAKQFINGSPAKSSPHPTTTQNKTLINIFLSLIFSSPFINSDHHSHTDTHPDLSPLVELVFVRRVVFVNCVVPFAWFVHVRQVQLLLCGKSCITTLDTKCARPLKVVFRVCASRSSYSASVPPCQSVD